MKGNFKVEEAYKFCGRVNEGEEMEYSQDSYLILDFSIRRCMLIKLCSRQTAFYSLPSV